MILFLSNSKLFLFVLIAVMSYWLLDYRIFFVLSCSWDRMENIQKSSDVSVTKLTVSERYLSAIVSILHFRKTNLLLLVQYTGCVLYSIESQKPGFGFNNLEVALNLTVIFLIVTFLIPDVIFLVHVIISGHWS